MRFEPSSRPVILAVDDDTDILESLAATLNEPGYEFHTARDVGSALARAEEVRPDLVICDINLGGENGLNLCDRMKEMPGLEQTPVMFLSGAQIPDIVRRSRAAGGVYYLRKPYDPEVLVELVDRALWMPHLVENQVTQG